MPEEVQNKARIYSFLLWVFTRFKCFFPVGIYFFPFKSNVNSSIDLYFELNDYKIIPSVHKYFKLIFLKKTYIFGFYKIKVDTVILLDAEIHNSLKQVLCINNTLYYSGVRNNPLFQVVMSLIMWRYIVLQDGKSIFFRLSPNFKSIITIRDTVISDQRNNQLVLTLVGFVSILLFWLPKKWRPVLMYEKEGEKFEESASILFKYIKKRGHGRVFFIISKEGLKRYSVPDDLKSFLLIKGTFKHYFYFSLCKVFIGTEAPAHAIDLRVVHPFAVFKLWLNKIEFVFLQHGVMYLVSLASETRKTFRRGKLYPIKTKIVVSSELEAEHFIKDGNYLPSDLYITGLPKFDNPVHSPNADSIVVMPTWRPWEYNLISSDTYQESGYYKMLRSIVDAIPEELLNKLIVLPHPLFEEALRSSDLQQYMMVGKPYEAILQNCNVLITDYSSISFDAFNRGCNVIFWWADKQDCMEKYKGHLMLTEELAFGPVVYSKQELTEEVNGLYNALGSAQYNVNFREIVKDFNGKSTENIYKKIVKDNLI